MPVRRRSGDRGLRRLVSWRKYRSRISFRTGDGRDHPRAPWRHGRRQWIEPRMTAPAAGGTLRFVLGDQLSLSLASLRDINPETDVVLMAEVVGECTYVRHHVKKIVFVLSAMRHFAEALRATGIRVDYRHLADAGNTGSLRGELVRAVQRHRPKQIVVTEPGEWRVRGRHAGLGDRDRGSRRDPRR